MNILAITITLSLFFSVVPVAMSQALQSIEEGPEMCQVIPDSLGMTEVGSITVRATCRELVRNHETGVEHVFVFDPGAMNFAGELPVKPMVSSVLLMMEKIYDSRVKVFIVPLRAESERKAAPPDEMEPVGTVLLVSIPMTPTQQ